MPFYDGTRALLRSSGGLVISSPTQLSGLVRWYKADALALNDGDPVGTWTDSTGGSDATQATASKKPIFKTAIQNGKPVVRFDGVDDVLGLTAFTASTKFTIFVVAKVTSGTDDYLIGGTTGGGTPAILTAFDPGSGRKGFEAFHNTAASANRQTLVTSTTVAWYVAGYMLNDAGGAGSFTGWVNGAQVFSTTIGDPVNGTGVSVIGAATTASANSAATDIGEICIYSSALTNPQASALMAYLNGRWKIY